MESEGQGAKPQASRRKSVKMDKGDGGQRDAGKRGKAVEGEEAERWSKAGIELRSSLKYQGILTGTSQRTVSA